MAEGYSVPISGKTSDGLAVTLSEVELGHLTQLAGWSDFNKTVDYAFRTQGLSVPSDYRSAVRGGMAVIWRIAPDRVLVRSETALALESANDVSVLDLSDSRVCLALQGPGASGLLSRVAALDFSDAAFPVGQFAQTAIHHISVLIDRQDGEHFTVLIPTTFARSIASFLTQHLAAETVSKQT